MNNYYLVREFGPVFDEVTNELVRLNDQVKSS